MLEPDVAKYYPLVSRAVGALEPNTAESRRAVYDRARTAQASQLRELDVGDSAIAHESQALEEAISIVELVTIATGRAEGDSEILSTYATFCEVTRTKPDYFYDVSVLPYPKHEIVAALERQIVVEPADIRVERLQQGQMYLWSFLEGIGSLPIPRRRHKRRFWTVASRDALKVIRRIDAALQIRQERLAIDKEFDRERLRLNDALADTAINSQNLKKGRAQRKSGQSG